jgi:GNAT superfamily N-acetyltransferase
LFDEGDMVAYAFFARIEGYQDILIDYLAVSAKTRGKGYGSQFLALMKEELKEFDSIIFEVESGKSAKTSEEVEVCQKRLEFYRKNGLKDSSLCLSLFGIDMKLLYLPLRKAPEEANMKEVLNHIYDDFYGVELHKEKVKFYE